MQKQQGGDAFCAVELKQLLCAKVVAEKADGAGGAGGAGGADGDDGPAAPPVGYAQGMADIAATLLMSMPGSPAGASARSKCALGEAIAGLHGLISLHLKACPPSPRGRGLPARGRPSRYFRCV